MFPIDNHSALIRQRQEELLRQAEHERLIRAARRELSRRNGRFYQRYPHWLRIHLVRGGHKLERYETLKQKQPTLWPSPHH